MRLFQVDKAGQDTKYCSSKLKKLQSFYVTYKANWILWKMSFMVHLNLSNTHQERTRFCDSGWAIRTKGCDIQVWPFPVYF